MTFWLLGKGAQRQSLKGCDLLTRSFAKPGGQEAHTLLFATLFLCTLHLKNIFPMFLTTSHHLLDVHLPPKLMMTKNDHQHDGLMLILTQMALPIGDQAKVNNSYSRMQRSYGNGEEDDPLQVSPKFDLKHKHHIMFETLKQPNQTTNTLSKYTWYLLFYFDIMINCIL